MREGWDFSFEGDMKFTSGNISLMSSLQVEGLSGINHGPRGGSAGPLVQSPGSHPFRELQNLARPETRMKITLEVPQAVLYHSLKTFCWGLEPL